jgi:hypothetical protein
MMEPDDRTMTQAIETWRKKRARGWVFTLAHPTEEEEQKIKNMIEAEDEKLKKAIVGIEEGSRRGTIDAFKHLQGYLYYKESMSGWQMRKHWSERAHWEPAKGSARSNWKYCSKEQNILATKGFEKEEISIQKKREKNEYWNRIIRDATEMSPTEFAEIHPKEWIIRRSAIERLMLEAGRKRMHTWNGKLSSKNVWIWGAPGVGKSRWAHQLKNTGETLCKMVNKWWEGMDPRIVTKVIIDDFPAAPHGDIHAHHVKVWADRYVFVGETKGSSMLISPGRFFLIVTANYPPDSCFSRTEDLEAIKRRFAVIEMTRANAKLLKRVQLDEGILQKAEEEWNEEEENNDPISLEEATQALKHEPSEEEEW